MSRIDEALVRAKSRLVAAALDENRAAFEMAPEGYPLEGATSNPRPIVAGPLPRGAAPAACCPSVEQSPARGDGKRVVGDKLVTRGADIMSTEQYSRLAAALHDAQIEQGLRTLMVTSAVPREGKTLTATNLALTLSGLYGRRVLLIDADLRRPSVHELLRLPNRIGLGCAAARRFAAAAARRVSPQLSVLVAGPPDASPMAALASTRMKSVLEDAANAVRLGDRRYAAGRPAARCQSDCALGGRGTAGDCRSRHALSRRARCIGAARSGARRRNGLEWSDAARPGGRLRSLLPRISLARLRQARECIGSNDRCARTAFQLSESAAASSSKPIRYADVPGPPPSLPISAVTLRASASSASNVSGTSRY